MQNLDFGIFSLASNFVEPAPTTIIMASPARPCRMPHRGMFYKPPNRWRPPTESHNPTVRRLLFLVATLSGLALASTAFRSEHGHGQKSFEEIARRHGTDKVTVHNYGVIYGPYLDPIANDEERAENFKLLEIGLGCDMQYGPGASVKVWREMFPEAMARGNVWFAEYDRTCAEKFNTSLSLLFGDQADFHVLDSWVETSGGGFDLIIDDGGHKNSQILNSFEVLFPRALKPGGMYIVEDLHTGRLELWNDGPGVASVVISEWVDQLLSIDGYGYAHTDAKEWEHLAPLGIESVHCAQSICAFRKCRADGASRCPDHRQAKPALPVVPYSMWYPGLMGLAVGVAVGWGLSAVRGTRHNQRMG